MRSIELFTGTGGLALGVARAGFDHALVCDWDRHACATVRENRKRVPEMADWEVVEGDVRDLDYGPHRGRITLLAAGAPCQPFSLGGKHRGDEDARNMFPEVFRATRELQPEAVVVENVKGLLRSGFREYFDYILLRLACPERDPLPDESWRQHKARLSVLDERNAAANELRFDVHWHLVNVADLGVPQRRERVVIVAFRRDLQVSWEGPKPTHSQDALLYAQYVDGSYWREHEMAPKPVPARWAARVAMLRQGPVPTEWRWRTVRDALRGLPEPEDYVEHPVFSNHFTNPGARSYAGHTGTPWDEPAKTLKAGVHGVPGGENMLRNDDGTVRYLTVREAARLQTFPDEYRFIGPWGECMRQLGNAVPVRLGEYVARLVGSSLEAAHQQARSVIEAAS